MVHAVAWLHYTRQFLAWREVNSGYEIEICPRHLILAWSRVHAGVKPFMKWTPVEAFAKSKTVLLNLSKLANLSDTKPASKNCRTKIL